MNAPTKLLAPAGNMEKLKVAVAYGADEVYFGLNKFSLRNFAGNFTIDTASEALQYLHNRNKQGFVALNIYPFEHEYEELLNTAGALAEMGVDALIVSDIGVLTSIRKAGIQTPIHISTQANTLSPQAVMAYRDLGASRVNLAREMSLEQIESLQKSITGIETEVFVHGAVCFSYSGRCAISDYMTGRRANRGECTHPCRWEYTIVEKERPGEYLPVVEDERGLYLFNSKDLALFAYVKPLMEAGVRAFKLEGRMKTIHYLASATSLYRRIMDGHPISDDEALQELSRVKNRGYSEGFMKGTITPEDYRFKDNTAAGHSKFLGIVAETDGTLVDVRNKIRAGEEVEILRPGGQWQRESLPQTLTDANGEEAAELNHGKHLRMPQALPAFSILRKIE